MRRDSRSRSGNLPPLCLAIALAGLHLGCARDCTNMGCGRHIQVRFDPPITEPGRYRFDLAIDGVQSSCEVDFTPERREDAPDGCRSLFVQGSSVPVDSYGVTEGAPYRIVGFDMDPAEDVSIAVYRADELWVEHAFEPVYRGVEVNGPGCGECPIAMEQIVLP